MDLEYCMAQMTHHAKLVTQLVTDASAEQTRWKPDENSWSMLEVVNHLLDEEREDFPVRLKHILDQADGLPPAIDPAGWVTERAYNQREMGTSLAQFLQERQGSLVWMKSLHDADWQTAIDIRPGRRLSAGDMLAAWVAHDLLHIRQLVELRYAYLKSQFSAYDVSYAGEW